MAALFLVDSTKLVVEVQKPGGELRAATNGGPETPSSSPWGRGSNWPLDAQPADRRDFKVAWLAMQQWSYAVCA